MSDLIAEKLTDLDYFIMLVYFLGITIPFLIGVFRICSKRVPMYFKLIVYAVGCRALEALATFVDSLCIGYVVYFRVSNLSIIAYYLFIISANSGLLDRFLDERTLSNKKARYLALVAPAAVTVMFVLFRVLQITDVPAFDAIAFGYVIGFVPMPICAYFCMKQLLMPPDPTGFLKTTRYVNVFVLVQILIESLANYSVLISSAASSVFAVLIGLSFSGIIFAVVKGEKIWKTLV